MPLCTVLVTSAASSSRNRRSLSHQYNHPHYTTHRRSLQSYRFHRALNNSSTRSKPTPKHPSFLTTTLLSVRAVSRESEQYRTAPWPTYSARNYRLCPPYPHRCKKTREDFRYWSNKKTASCPATTVSTTPAVSPSPKTATELACWKSCTRCVTSFSYGVRVHARGLQLCSWRST